jgi:hypothetical protein
MRRTQQIWGMNTLPFTPRGMSRRQAAQYIGCNSVSAFDAMRRRGLIPGPIPGTRLWDKKALDRALDMLSGIAPEGYSEADAWFAENDRARAA